MAAVCLSTSTVAVPGLAHLNVAPALADAFQADDKSFDLSLPAAWSFDDEDARRPPPELFRLTAARGGSSVRIVVTVTLGKYGKSLAELGSAEAAVARVLLPNEALESAERVPGKVRGSSYYLGRYTDGARRGIVKLGVQQDRLYALRAVAEARELSNGASGASLQADIDTIVSSFSAFPINFICMGQSNAGKVPVAGSCY